MPTFISAIRSLARDLRDTHLRFGVTRAVIVTQGFAIKIARTELGCDCNRYEHEAWANSERKPIRRSHLCPVLWCSAAGEVLVMPAVAPISDEQLAQMEAYSFWWWDGEPGDPGAPFEGKREDWGSLNGTVVATDYANLAQVEAVSADPRRKRR